MHVIKLVKSFKKQEKYNARNNTENQLVLPSAFYFFKLVNSEQNIKKAGINLVLTKFTNCKFLFQVVNFKLAKLQVIHDGDILPSLTIYTAIKFIYRNYDIYLTEKTTKPFWVIHFQMLSFLQWWLHVQAW